MRNGKAVQKMIEGAMKAFQNGLDALCDKKCFWHYGNCLGALALVVAKYGACLLYTSRGLPEDDRRREAQIR